MRSPLGALAFLALAAAAFLGVGCGDAVIDEAKAEDTLQVSLEESLERKITAVDCPSDQKVEAGARFTCSVRFSNGDRATVTLKIRNSDADVSIVGLEANE